MNFKPIIKPLEEASFDELKAVHPDLYKKTMLKYPLYKEYQSVKYKQLDFEQKVKLYRKYDNLDLLEDKDLIWLHKYDPFTRRKTITKTLKEYRCNPKIYGNIVSVPLDEVKASKYSLKTLTSLFDDFDYYYDKKSKTYNFDTSKKLKSWDAEKF